MFHYCIPVPPALTLTVSGMRLGFETMIQQGIIMGQKNTYVVISILCIVPSIVSDILAHTSHSGQFSTQHIGG